MSHKPLNDASISIHLFTQPSWTCVLCIRLGDFSQQSSLSVNDSDSLQENGVSVACGWVHALLSTAYEVCHWLCARPDKQP
jgi:hypothetical protein